MAGLRTVLNRSESGVDQLLSEYAHENGYRVLVKMRLRDVIDASDFARNNREKNFLWTSHVDFIIVDTSTNIPVLAVEYDGPSHTSASQVERDQIKDRLCRKSGLPVLRIDSSYARREGKWNVLKYILFIHDVGKAFIEAQESGYIPRDEPFIHYSILEPTHDGNSLSFTGLDMPAIRYLRRFRLEFGALWEREWWRSTDTHVETRLLLALPGGLYLSAHCSVRDFVITGISAVDISQELAGAELGWLARKFAMQSPVAIGKREALKILAEVKTWHMRSSWSAGKPVT
ncbi:DUF2726 domain-containing protein [Nocardia cyriacigeorgica]|uniref:DUF2726 domain-containing protein n=1 Tax=Nocardia cyriacigeorgica TaxID=135487 RepID=UPI003093BCDE|nr:hypothetical protein FMUAM8_42890 [Nocardia cyriacigeorgica]